MASHDYSAIVKEALTGPHKFAEAYRLFWNYSLGNQYLAMIQLKTPEPINTFNGWKKLGRFVKKDEKAIALLMPVTKQVENRKGEKETTVFYISKKAWFGLSQTDGETFAAPQIPDFDLDLCLEKLGIKKEAFECVNGNAQGYAVPDAKTIAISPIAFDPIKTALHEIAHCLLHSGQTMSDTSELSSDVREVEAELTAYLVKSLLGITKGLEYSRGYIRNWIENDTCEKVRFAKVFGAVDRIIKSGRSVEEPLPLPVAA